MSLHLGTSSFTASGWETAFYPPKLKDDDRLTYYAEHFDTVEIDSTFYRSPSLSTVRGWHDKTPAHFRFAAKVPQRITHEQVLVDCQEDFARFVETMQQGLGEKLGPLLLQFPYFNKKAFAKPDEFLARLEKFLARAPLKGLQLAVELRNKAWLGEALFEILRPRNLALVLIDHPWLLAGPHWEPTALWQKLDALTADFAYVRLLGDRYKIEEETKVWDKVIVDRHRELADWTSYMRKISHRGVDLWVYINNHYAGFAPATAEELLKLWKGKAAKA